MERACYNTYVKGFGKVLIPGCWAVTISNDMNTCTCRDMPRTWKQFEKKEYNETVNGMKKYILELEQENAKIYRILRKVKGYSKQ